MFGLLDEKCRRTDGVFDEKLADYVFFPLSHVLRVCQNRPGRLAEVSTQCLQVLLAYGWTKAIRIDLAQQLLILLTLFAGGGPSSFLVSEELKREAFNALALLYDDIRRTPKGPTSIIEVSVIPALGQCLSTILDGITDGPSQDIQIEALEALKSMWACIKDQEALSTFLPGTVSALTKCLMPSIKNPRSNKVLISGLQALRDVITTIIGDVRVTNLQHDPAEGATDPQPTMGLTKSWLNATSAQVKLALANIVKLRSHNSESVRCELERTCLVLLDECHSSLESSSALLVETSMIVATSRDEDCGFSRQTSLKDLAIIHPSIGELIKTATYNWATSLPRIMQSSDETAKASALQHLSQARTFLDGLDVGSDVLDNSVLESLGDSVVNMLDSSVSKQTIQVAPVNNDMNKALTLSSQNGPIETYQPLIMAHKSQLETKTQFNNFIGNIGPPDVQLRMANEMLERMFGATGNTLLASFWLSFQLLKTMASKTEDLNKFFTSAVTSSDDQEIVMEGLYNHAVSILSDPESHSNDWRLHAVGLEVIAYSSQRLKEAFKPDLVDTLYSVVRLLGSSSSDLRDHAIITLNIISKSCGYSQTSELIVENVDYLVNAVSLKLNTFDVSPQAPRVLIMMIRLSGPTLLPYLDDVVGSIFGALDNFHGYPQLVDSLFSVLGEIVEEATRSGQLQITSGTEINHQKQKAAPPKISDVLKLLQDMNRRSSARDGAKHEDFPQRPWKDAETLLDEAEGLNGAEKDEGRQEDQEIGKVPPTKVYTMVESIVRLSQHYLTSTSPHLRLRLLNLLGTASGALHNNEDSFLPLVNDIWPVVVKRLYDSEPYVVTGAANTIAKICEAAGDFMATRIHSEWLDLIKLIRQWKNKAEAERRGKHGRGVHSQTWQVWESMVGMLIAILKHVRIDDGMFDEVLDILAGLLDREDVRGALETINADAVWLVDFTQGRIPERNTPVMEGYKFAVF